MKNISKYIMASMLSIGALNALSQQTLQFSQYVFNGLSVNPAYAGYKEDWTVNASYRTQWVGIDGAPRTATLSVDGLTNNADKKMALGLTASNDRLGPQNNTDVYLNYAYRLQLDAADTKRLNFGIAFGATQYSIDGSKFVATDPNDIAAPSSEVGKLTPDFRAGVYYHTPNFYLGASVLNLLATAGDHTISDGTYKVIRQARHLYLTGGVLLPLSPMFDLKPTFMIKEDFKGPTNLDLNTYLLIDKKFWIGASYRTGVKLWDKNNLQKDLEPDDAISAIVDFMISDRYRIGYAFDFTMSRLANYQHGTHEISVGITLPAKRGRIKTPRFF
jgi:type IX secretion system PorP/SprF family membrane protein